MKKMYLFRELQKTNGYLSRLECQFEEMKSELRELRDFKESQLDMHNNLMKIVKHYHEKEPKLTRNCNEQCFSHSNGTEIHFCEE